MAHTGNYGVWPALPIRLALSDRFTLTYRFALSDTRHHPYCSLQCHRHPSNPSLPLVTSTRTLFDRYVRRPHDHIRIFNNAARIIMCRASSMMLWSKRCLIFLGKAHYARWMHSPRTDTRIHPQMQSTRKCKREIS